jgi:beta-glucosidase/6-phospho-beta-glucosidase/beta-galactosidase
MNIFKEIEKETANYTKPKTNDYFRFNYYQWATPRTLREARQFGLVKAWRKQTQNIKQGSDI